MTEMSCQGSIWPIISSISGSVSFFSSFISLFPQIIETFRDKTVEGLSPYFLLAWVAGDITTLSGAILTKQLLFQVVMAAYFLANDLFVCGQYYYYGILYQNRLATTGHESKPRITEENEMGATNGRSTKNSAIASALAVASTIGTAEALPVKTMIASIIYNKTAPATPPDSGSDSDVGRVLSWAGAVFYVGARIPQLWKNYKRKSTDGIAPFLFITTLLCNLTYDLNILTSCEFIGSTDRKAFISNALPFLLGASITILLDMIYFYQHYVLYASDMRLRALECEQAQSEVAETSPLLHPQQH